MMRKVQVVEYYRVVSLLLLAVVSMSLQAGPVSQEEAMRKAKAFMKGKILKEPTLKMESGVGKNNSTGEQAFYVFNTIGNNGFVIVSGDDRTEPILGYADKGAIDTSHMPENLRNWLEGYAEEIGSLDDANQVTLTANPSWAAIDPLIECQINDLFPLLCIIISPTNIFSFSTITKILNHMRSINICT